MHFHVFDIEDLILFNAGRLSSARALLYLCSVNQRDVICPSRKHNLHILRRSQVTKKKRKKKKTHVLEITLARCITESDSAKAMGAPNKLNDVTRG